MKTAHLPIIDLKGSPRERGRHYGNRAKAIIAESLAAWRSDLGNYRRNSLEAKPMDADAYLDAFLSQANYLPTIEKWCPDLLEEVKGIAEGAGQSYDNILGLQLGDEEWIFGLHQQLDKPTEKCTAFAVKNPEGLTSYAGQNLDVSSWADGKQALLRVMPKGNAPEALVVTMAGNIAWNGINASGLGITCNTLSQLHHSRDGLPVSFIVRSVLEKNTLDEAEDFLRSIPHASGQNYILSSRDEMRCFECCGSSVVAYAPEQYRGSIFHTNHPLVNTDESALLPPEKKRSLNTQARLHSICDRLGRGSQLISLEDCKAALSAHDDPENPVSRNVNHDGNSIGFTAAASIYELGDQPRLHLAAGPPCETDFMTFEFEGF
ncbi:C45 family autoproteolytic acyltransferase/hydrolase [Porticoccaceae bacterium]|nr:C45 family autoproteolytic acyltransferase/hydrolase [Porticoccaceae bacterium]MDC1513639.1 C45 family autoproteolytic acyltransferase/hydrolase [Porticoccaceae bacterium]